jgi:hypothetical protein
LGLPRASINRCGNCPSFFESIAKLSPNTEAQRFIQKRELEINGAIRQTRAHARTDQQFHTLAIADRSVFWISMLFGGFGLFACANATAIVAHLIGAISVSTAIFLILKLNHP